MPRRKEFDDEGMNDEGGGDVGWVHVVVVWTEVSGSWWLRLPRWRKWTVCGSVVKDAEEVF